LIGVGVAIVGSGFEFIGALFFLIAVVSALDSLIRRSTTEIAMTTHRFVFKTGLVRRNTWEISRARIEGVDVHQGVLGRLLGYGAVTVRGVGTGYEPISRVAKPLTLRRAVTEAAADLART
jgi:uncharacterized membrane protein YdbT with pleckstrin-like domain